MDQKTASVLLASLLERIARDQVIGAVSSLENQALHLAIRALSGEVAETNSTPPIQTAEPTLPKAIKSSAGKVQLVLDSLTRGDAVTSSVLMCLDFGTAMSKAFATQSPDKYLDLELGSAAGRQGYTLPSSVFIGDDGKAYFGFEAIDQSQELVESGRERLDSIKSWLSLRSDGNLDSESCLLLKPMNPTEIKLTQGDLIRIYLAYLTDIAEMSLVNRGNKSSRYLKRRFARPCWSDPGQEKWATEQMRSMLAEAQILADTFSDRWAGGIDVVELRDALDQIKALQRRPDYLIDEGVPEPVAVAAGAIADTENLRDAFMVVDVGAGTTDFGLFVATKKPDEDDAKVFQVPASIRGLKQAGDTVDRLLRGFIMRKESVDQNDTSGKIIFADLARRIRGLKEALFKAKKLEYVLADGTTGELSLDEFLGDAAVKRFGSSVAAEFTNSLNAMDDTWLRWLAMEGVKLNVVLTGGSSSLPMVQSLTEDFIEVRGHRIIRQRADPMPEWMDDKPEELQATYPQLAVAIGGAAEHLPQTLTAPPAFGGGSNRQTYVAGRLHVAGS